MKLPPQPVSSWTKRGWTATEAPTAKMIQESADTGNHQRLKGFKFDGAGWYPKHKVLVVQVSEDTYELHFYDQDPRPAFDALANYRTK